MNGKTVKIVKHDLNKLPKWARERIQRLERQCADQEKTLLTLGGCSLADAQEHKVFAHSRTSLDQLSNIPLDEHSEVNFDVGDVKHGRNGVRVKLLAYYGKEVLQINCDARLRIVPSSSNTIMVYPSEDI